MNEVNQTKSKFWWFWFGDIQLNWISSWNTYTWIILTLHHMCFISASIKFLLPYLLLPTQYAMTSILLFVLFILLLHPLLPNSIYIFSIHEMCTHLLYAVSKGGWNSKWNENLSFIITWRVIENIIYVIQERFSMSNEWELWSYSLNNTVLCWIFVEFHSMEGVKDTERKHRIINSRATCKLSFPCWWKQWTKEREWMKLQIVNELHRDSENFVRYFHLVGLLMIICILQRHDGVTMTSKSLSTGYLGFSKIRVKTHSAHSRLINYFQSEE